MPKSKEPALTYEMVIAEILRTASGPLPAQDLAAQMLLALPSFARNPQQAMRQHIRQANGRQLVFLDADTVLPLHLAYQGARFRLPLERDSFNKGLLPLRNVLSPYLPGNFEADRLQFVDASGNAIPMQMRRVEKTIRTFLGPFVEGSIFAELGDWYHAQKIDVKDHILVTLLDWEQGVLQLEGEPASRRNQALLSERNRLVANMFFDLLESASSESINVNEAVPTVYARLPEKDGYPPNHWIDVLEADGRMKSNGFEIYYSDTDDPQSLLGLGGVGGKETKAPPGKAQREQVYRFKAHLLGRPKIWREIEIQGKQTLAHLDHALRSAFNHDPYDHMGGFWKLIPRGAPVTSTSKRGSRPARTREVEIGDVKPMGGGDGARIKVAELGLAVGEQLKYVYDFGDWIEHTLTLLTIEATQEGVEYPREVARNKLKYSYCARCKQEGRHQVAMLICLTCSNDLEQNVLLCEACAEKHDEEHYIEEILY